MLYNFVLGKRTKSTRFEKVSIWRSKFWSELVKEEVVSKDVEGKTMSRLGKLEATSRPSEGRNRKQTQ
jgi:hypothetical protein